MEMANSPQFNDVDPKQGLLGIYHKYLSWYTEKIFVSLSELQFEETLIAARTNPESFPDLIVCMLG